MSYDRNAILPTVPGLRLLPWTTETGNPCFLSTEEDAGLLSRLADEVESEQLHEADTKLKDGRAVLNDGDAGDKAVRQALESALSALSDALRVADSRGSRLPDPYDADDERPHLPAKARG